MEITIEPGLITADSHIFNTKPKAFRDQQASTRFFSIPIQQREYSWGIHTNRIDDLLEDLLLFKNSKESKSELDESKDQYFAGTILLENQNSDTLKVIDGQQRLTTIFLLNFANFLICRYKLSSISVDKTPYAYAIEQSKRWQNFVAAERRVFSVDFSDQLEDFVSEENGSISENSLEWETRLGVKQDEYWNSVTPRLRFLEENRADELLNVLESTKLVVDQDSARISIEIDSKQKSRYFDGVKAIIEFLSEHLKNKTDSIDFLLEKISQFVLFTNENCGLCAIISENEDDSFRLFEILNARGEDLSALDLVKNLILEKTNPDFPSDFSTRWDKLKQRVLKTFSKGQQDTTFVANIIRSEGSAISRKEFSYLSNREIDPSNTDSRHLFYKNKDYYHFFDRLEASSEVLFDIYKAKNPFEGRYAYSAFQNISFMKRIDYKWGVQASLGANILFQEANLLDKSKPRSFNEGDSMGIWFERNTSFKEDPLKHFLRAYTDFLLKLGVIGIVTHQQTKKLPQTSKKIVREILDFLHKRTDKTAFRKEELSELLKRIIGIGTEIINSDSFQKELEFYIASNRKKRDLFGAILYYIYGRNGQVNNYSRPEKEHIEPQTIGRVQKGKYTSPDRKQQVDRIGNFMLIESDHNKKLSNLSIREKLDLVEKDEDLRKNPIYQHPLFQHLYAEESAPDYNPEPSVPSLTKGDLESDQFKADLTPNKSFFNKRSRYFSKVAHQLFCNSSKFLDSTRDYFE